MKIALFGGIYNNYLALDAVCRDALEKGCRELYCLGDLGAFGPYPDRVFPILKEYGVKVVRGNYDDSVGRGLDNCQCGYTDPRDNYYAHLSFQYTSSKTSEANRRLLKDLPEDLRLSCSGREIFLCHGSPRRVNEFLWESTSPTHLLEKFCDDYSADIICVTHTGLHWKRALSNDRWFVNVGAIGRPPNNGKPSVYYTVLDFDLTDPIRFVAVDYDHNRLAEEMAAEKLPKEFIETILTGHWTTCLEILPARERRTGRY